MGNIVILYVMLSMSQVLLSGHINSPGYNKYYKGVDTLGDSIKWSPDYKLTFGDFQAKEKNKELAKLEIGYSSVEGNSFVGISYDVKTEGKKTIVDAFGLFIKSKSWLKGTDEKVIKHEQGHFDIAEIYARKFEQAMKQYQDIIDASYWETFFKTYNEINEELIQEQHNYDNFAHTTIGQEFYYKKIQDQLKSSQ